jgi:hypothetical protein
VESKNSRKDRYACWPLLWVLSFSGLEAFAAPSLVEQLGDGVYEVRDDGGQWPGDMSRGITHQNHAAYQAKKVLDLSDVSDDVWRQTREVRLSAFFMVRDYSGHDNKTPNGLDEALEVVVNGKVHRYSTNCGAPVFGEGKPPAIGWYDFVLPKEDFVQGRNEIILRKAASDKNDDYLYLGIDESQKRGNSYVAFDGKTWTQDKLTVPGGNGEYMVRLYLLARETACTVRWQPGQPTELDDPAQVILYAGARRGQATTDGLRLPAGESARIEWHPLALDLLRPVQVTVEGTGAVRFAWLDEAGQPDAALQGNLPLTQSLPAQRPLKPSGLAITATDGPLTLKTATLSAAAAFRPLPKRINLCPRMTACPGTGTTRPASRELRGFTVVLESASTPDNAGLRCQFEKVGNQLHLVSLYNHNTQCEMLRDPAQAHLFVVEIEGRRYVGNRDFRLQSLGLAGFAGTDFAGDNAIVAVLELPQPPLVAALYAKASTDGLRLTLHLENNGSAPVDFKLAFPHLAGLAISENPADDYYFFPWGGGIIADVPAHIRRGYGDHEALYQVMDLFSPSRGGGLSLRLDDADGWHKTLALRKHLVGRSETDAQRHVRQDHGCLPMDDGFPGGRRGHRVRLRIPAPHAPAGTEIFCTCHGRSGGASRRLACRAASLRGLGASRVEIPAFPVPSEGRPQHDGRGLGTELSVSRRQVSHGHHPASEGGSGPDANRLCRVDVLVGLVAAGPLEHAVRQTSGCLDGRADQAVASLFRPRSGHRPNHVEQSAGRLRRLQSAVRRTARLSAGDPGLS